MATHQAHELRPGITNPGLWYPERPPKTAWGKIRKVVLERDKNTYQFCGHVAKRFMNIHHVNETGENEPDNLITCCVACHAVMHMGRTLSLGTIQIWRSEISQVEIVQNTREGIKNGKDLRTINKHLPLTKGPYEPKSIEYANSLIATIGNNPSATRRRRKDRGPNLAGPCRGRPPGLYRELQLETQNGNPGLERC